ANRAHRGLPGSARARMAQRPGPDLRRRADRRRLPAVDAVAAARGAGRVVARRARRWAAPEIPLPRVLGDGVCDRDDAAPSPPRSPSAADVPRARRDGGLALGSMGGGPAADVAPALRMDLGGARRRPGRRDLAPAPAAARAGRARPSDGRAEAGGRRTAPRW